MRNISTPYLPENLEIQPVSLGGTGADNPTQACLNLGILNSDDIGVIYPKIANTGKIDSVHFKDPAFRKLCIKGPKKIPVSGTATYEITDFSLSKDYSFSVTAGSIERRSGCYLTYSAPATPQNVTLTVNQTDFLLVIAASIVNKPVIISPANDINQSLKPYVSSTNFDNNGGSTTHASTDWQISLYSNFSTIAAESTADNVNLTTWQPSTLTPDTFYYLRCRYRDSLSNVSDWSDFIGFKTRANFFIAMNGTGGAPNTPPEAILFRTGSYLLNSKIQRQRMAVSRDGLRIFSTYPDDQSSSRPSAGILKIWKRDGQGWANETVVRPTEYNYGYYGLDICCGKSDGSSLFVAQKGSDSRGSVVYLTRSGTVWTVAATITGSASTASSLFGGDISTRTNSISCDATASRLAVGDPGTGTVYIYSISGATVTEEKKITNPSLVTANNFGICVRLSSDGSRLIIGANTDSVDGTVGGNKTGAVYTYTRSGTTWTYQGKLTPTSYWNEGSNYGKNIEISDDGSRLIIGASGESRNNVRNAGTVYIYKYSSGWLYERFLSSADDQANKFFGESLFINATGDLLIAGKPYNPDSDYSPGQIMIYTRLDTTWYLQATIKPEDSLPGDCFGQDIKGSSDGSLIAVRAPYRLNGPTSEIGATFVWR